VTGTIERNRMPEENKNTPDTSAVKTRRRIAREARERIALIAARIPGARSMFRPLAEEPRKVNRLVVISDTHFGDPNELLVTPPAIEQLTGAIAGMGTVDELVLLGDIFDFWQAPFPEAIARARDLMAALFTLDNVGRMVYLIGNHDHHVFRMWYEGEVSKKLEAGDLDQPELAIPLVKGCPAMQPLTPPGATVPLYMTYPMYQVQVRDKVVLLTHGHLLGFYERSLWAPKRHSRFASLVLNRSDKLDLDDMERFISPYYEMTALSTSVPGVVEGRYWIYRMVNRTSRMWGVRNGDRMSFYRGTTVEDNAVEIEALLNHFCPEMPDYFIYGHTHRAGRLALPLSGTTAINSGCWLGGDTDENSRNNLVEISDEARLIKL
jgi:UDP-2,3-diacylglucosamine pyrophosphatase LpxH